MIDFEYCKLLGRIHEICGTQETFAKAIGRSVTSVNAKLNNHVQFTQGEIVSAVNALKLNNSDIPDYFFKPKV